jgi:uncharacterized membrane protein HdeD (DUF308 family)
MNFNILLTLLVPVVLIASGVLSKFTNKFELSPIRKYWLFFVILGLISLIIDICKFW